MSEQAASHWSAADVWSRFVEPNPSAPEPGRAGVWIRPIGRTALATLVAARGKDEALARIAAERFGVEPPQPGRWSQGEGAAMVWSAPRQWLIVGHRGTVTDLADAFADVAAATDQTDGRALIGVGGPDARDALSGGFAIDLDPRAFPPGSCAATKVAHVGVQVWAGRDDTFTIAVPRSFTLGFWSWLRLASRPYGYDVETWS